MVRLHELIVGGVPYAFHVFPRTHKHPDYRRAYESKKYGVFDEVLTFLISPEIQ